MIFGVDEAGRGPLAGPVVAAAVLLCTPRPSGLDDSKKLSAAHRGRFIVLFKLSLINLPPGNLLNLHEAQAGHDR